MAYAIAETTYMVLARSSAGDREQYWPEMTEEMTGHETIIFDCFNGEYDNVLAVVAFNVVEGWSRDVSFEIAKALVELARQHNGSLSSGVESFVARHGFSTEDLQGHE